jgi:HD-GYP domain-containing protein (c-di-GMP phosphodiesterase class II)
MKKNTLIFRSFQFRVTVAFIVSMLFISVLSNFLIYKFALDSQLNDFKDKLKIIAQTAALTIDADTLMEVPLNRSGIDTPAYKTIVEKLAKIKKVNPPIRFIYTMTKTQRDGIWQFIVDPEPDLAGQRKKTVSAYPGDSYEARRFPEMMKAFNGPSADTKPEIDEWGVTWSGYAPIYDRNGVAVAVLGVDILAPEVSKMQKVVHLRAVFVLLLGILFSVILGIFISRRISEPIKKLAQATHRVAAGDLHYQVNVKGDDEIGALAASFNGMATRLRESRNKIHGYFYDVIQSLVRIVEARDRYTRGHSERVAEYAAKIAVTLGFSPDEIEVLKETALVHDIGKLGIQESVLNKKEKLTEEEWEMIRKHPLIGENILKPVALNQKMLSIVRGHHERYDGKGYPDGLKAHEIDTFAQLLCVVDAYDAMTSSRAYRPAFSKGEALEELKRNKGTQFNSKIVDVFVQIVQGEFIL